MPRNTTQVMWAEALGVFARVDRLHRDFFRPVTDGWEPPVDLFETDDELVVVAALPGVRPDDVEIVIGAGELAIVGTRLLPAPLRTARVHRMELPYGRFARRVRLPPGTYNLVRRDLEDGVLSVALRKVG